MKFGQLHPMLGWTHQFGHQLIFDCPTCAGKQIALSVSIDGNPKPPATWGLSYEQPPNFSWDEVTLTPSINSVGPDRHGRGVPCVAHFSVVNGNVLINQS